MARIEGVNLPKQKRVEYGLTYVYGIGLKSSQEILNTLKIDFNKRVKSLSEQEVASIQKMITTTYTTEGELRKEVRENIQRLQGIGSFRGIRHKKGLPVRGQRTKTNARTRKGPRGLQIAGKKKSTKK